ncbi:MAG: T9SS type A sorting domain-containing protein [Bacteroidia bacterium]
MKKIFTLLVSSLLVLAGQAQDPLAKINVSKSIWCEGELISFGNRSLNADSFFWYMDDGTTYDTKTATHAFSISNIEDSFRVSLVAVDKATNKKDSVTQLIRVEKKATAFYDYKAIAIVCFFYPKCENYLGLDWEFGDGENDLKDADSITHIYPGTGTYKCQLVATTSFQCNDTFTQDINIVDSAGGSISENNKYKMQLFPNPSTIQTLSFELDRPETLDLSISDASGKMVYSLNNTYNVGQHQIQVGEILTEYPEGLYFVAINNSKATYVLKVHKRR